MGEARRVGVFLDHIETDYHTEVLHGVRRAAARSGVSIVVVPGGEFAEFEGRSPRAFLYRFAAEAKFDGLVLLSGCLTNHEGPEGLANYVARLGGTPAVSIGARVPATRAIYVDNELGFERAVLHLIEAHGHRRIAFLQGPESSAEGDARQRGYERALAKHGIAIDERLIVRGGFLRSEGVTAIAELLDERGFKPGTLDAIACVNDETAHGVLDELSRRGIGVPRPFAVIGFDDAKFAQVTNPPLSTVKQRAREQGEAALLALVEMMAGSRSLEDVAVDAPTMLRDSCGCRGYLANDSSSVHVDRPRVARTCRLGLIERRSSIALALSRAALGKLVGTRDWEGKLVDGLSAQIESAEGGAFHWEFERLARLHATAGGDPLICHEVLTALRLQALACAEVEPSMRQRLEDIFQEGRLILARVALSVGQEHMDTLNHRMRMLVRACLEQVGLPDEEALGRTLAEHLPGLGIDGYAVSRLLPEGGFDLVAFRASGLRLANSFFLPPSSLGIPEGLERHAALVVEPLTYERRPVGVAVFTWGALEPTVYEELRDLLGMVLYLESVTRQVRASEPSGLRASLHA